MNPVSALPTVARVHAQAASRARRSRAERPSGASLGVSARPGRLHRGPDHADLARAGPGALPAAARPPDRGSGQHPRADPAGHRGAGRCVRHGVQGCGGVARRRPPPGPTGRPDGADPQRAHPGHPRALGGPPGSGRVRQARRRGPGPADRRTAGMVRARRAERRSHRVLPAGERPASTARPPAPAEHSRRPHRGTRRRSALRDRGLRSAGDRDRCPHRLRRRAVRRFTRRAAHRSGGPTRAAGDRFALARPRRAVLRPPRRAAPR